MKRVEKKISVHDLFPFVKELLAEKRQAVFTITGSSMLPFLGGSRDQVYLGSCDVCNLKKGDIILFQKDAPSHAYILHRVHRILESGYLPMGDGNLFTDEPIRSEQVIGVVTAVVRKGKHISCHSFSWRVCSTLWRWLTPVRPGLLGGYRFLAGVKKQIRGESL